MSWQAEQQEGRLGLTHIVRHHEGRRDSTEVRPCTVRRDLLRPAQFQSESLGLGCASEYRGRVNAPARHYNPCSELTLRLSRPPPVRHLKHAVAFGKIRRLRGDRIPRAIPRAPHRRERRADLIPTAVLGNVL